ncbi:CCC motif membrane protein, partial [Eudoraea sp.]
MEQEKLPNITLAIVLAILSYICCCFGGLPGAIIAGIAFFLIKNDEKKYIENPEGYSNYSQLKT